MNIYADTTAIMIPSLSRFVKTIIHCAPMGEENRLNKHATEIRYLSPHVRRRFKRAIRLLGKGTQSQWLNVQVRRLIREAEQRLGERYDSDYLTEEERFICEVIEDGAAELAQIVAETHLGENKVRTIVKELIEYGWLEERRKGGKTDSARGASVRLLFLKRPLPDLVEDPESK